MLYGRLTYEGFHLSCPASIRPCKCSISTSVSYALYHSALSAVVMVAGHKVLVKLCCAIPKVVAFAPRSCCSRCVYFCSPNSFNTEHERSGNLSGTETNIFDSLANDRLGLFLGPPFISPATPHHTKIMACNSLTPTPPLQYYRSTPPLDVDSPSYHTHKHQQEAIERAEFTTITEILMAMLN